MQAIRNNIVQQIEIMAGRHDEEAIYGGPAGAMGLTGGPDSMSWEINGDFASVTGAGSSAILMQVLHPSVMHGVFTQSSYRTDPFTRSRNTLALTRVAGIASAEDANQAQGVTALQNQ